MTKVQVEDKIIISVLQVLTECLDFSAFLQAATVVIAWTNDTYMYSLLTIYFSSFCSIINADTRSPTVNRTPTVCRIGIMHPVNWSFDAKARQEELVVPMASSFSKLASDINWVLCMAIRACACDGIHSDDQCCSSFDELVRRRSL